MTTTALVPVFTGTLQDQPIQLCNARDLHAALQSGQEFANWIKNRIEQYGFIDGEDYLINLSNRADGRGGKRRTDYHLTLDMAKELAMVENNERGRQVRRYFIAIEKATHTTQPNPDATRFTLTAEELAAVVDLRVKRKLADARYRYPREMLEQAPFITPNRPAGLDIAMLASPRFESALAALLAELTGNGHDISACAAELDALQAGIQHADKTLEALVHSIWAARFEPVAARRQARALLFHGSGKKGSGQ